MKKAQMEYQNSYIAEKYDRINITVPKGRKDYYRDRAQAAGMSLNQLINKLLNDWVVDQICSEPDELEETEQD